MQDQARMTPEAGSPAASYGSAIHDVIEAVEDGHTDEAAIEMAWAKWGSVLSPEDLSLLRDDLAKFRTRDFENVRTVLSEGEIRVPLTEMPDGRPVWFRGRIDRLYERLDAPGSFIHIDYKSSKWNKSQDEVDEDPQMWAYNWALTEYFPEIEELEQWYDQFRHGMVPTRKSDAQRIEIREWLAVNARNYFGERELLEDGLPAPRFNQWCPWCPILESCAVIPQLSEWARTRIDVLRPPGLEGEVEATPIDEYMAQYTDVQTAIKTLERYAESTKTLIREMPAEERDRLGFELRDRRNSVLPVRALEAIHELVGHRRFLEMARITQERLKSIEDDEQREWALGLVEKVPGTQVVHKRR